jgi:hypothetical protein
MLVLENYHIFSRIDGASSSQNEIELHIAIIPKQIENVTTGIAPVGR